MNLADSVKLVLKNKSQSIFSEFWKEDLSHLLGETKGDISGLIRNGSEHLRYLKTAGVKGALKELVDSGFDAVTILRVIPSRVKNGFFQFRNEVIDELDRQSTQKQKTLFILKILGALSRFAIGVFYNLKIGNADLSFVGLKRRNAFTQLLIAELVFKISQIFILRFLVEVEKHLTDPDELNNLRYFKALFADRDKLESERENLEAQLTTDDRAILLVDDLKRFIMTGQK